MTGRWKKRRKRKVLEIIVITLVMILAFAFILFAIIFTYSTAPGEERGQKRSPFPKGQRVISGLGR
jgi:hypothetical protein